MVRRLHQGIVIEPETLAYDVIANVGPGGNYLMEMHTVKRCRKEFWKPKLCDRAGLEAWTQGGQQDAVDRARARWHQLVAEHEDPPLDEVTARQLRDYMDRKTD
jgi:trimethylamine--corrinoid protein Co-methyltransferase